MIFYFFIFLSFSVCQNLGVVDGILVVVEDNIILRSDIEEQVFLLAKEKNISPQKQPLAFDRLFKKIIEEQIDRLVVLSFAKKDTFISVSKEEVNNTLNKRIDSFIGVFGSKEALEDTMKMSVNSIKNEYFRIIEEELFVEKFRYFNFNNTSISRQDVLSFYKENPDSFNVKKNLVDFSLIQHPIELGFETKDSVFSFAKNIKDSLDLKRFSFEEAAKKHSQDLGSASFGGSLGYTARGTFLPEYEKVAFSLNIGEVSLPIESEKGYHLILLVDRLGEKINTKHILFSLKPGKKDLKEITKKLNEYKASFFYDPSSFDSLSISYYEKHKNMSGNYVGFNFLNLPPFLQNELSLLEDFSFSEVFEEGGFLFLLYKYKKRAPEKISLEGDWALVESVALAHKNFIVFQEWIKHKKKSLYIKKFYN